MNNRQRLTGRLHKNISKYLREELDWQLNGVDREEEGYDLADAFADVYEIAEDRDKELTTACRAILIELGFYYVMSEEEVRNTVVTSGTVWDFKLNKKPYRCVSSWGEWITK